MKKIILIFIIVVSISCSESKKDAPYQYPFKGYWSGTFTRNGQQGTTITGNGTIFFQCDNSGNTRGGYDVINLDYFSLEGAIDTGGNLVLSPTGTDVGYAATFVGRVDESNKKLITGTWIDQSRNWTGVFSATRN